MILSRSLRLMNFNEPEEDDECFDGNLKLGFIFDYKNTALIRTKI